MWQRVCLCLVALVITKLAKENDPEENPTDFPNQPVQEIIFTLF